MLYSIECKQALNINKLHLIRKQRQQKSAIGNQKQLWSHTLMFAMLNIEIDTLHLENQTIVLVQ